MSDDEIDRFVSRLVDELLSDPRYIEYLESDELLQEMITTMTVTMLEHPSFQTTPEEDCATVVLMSVAMDPTLGLPDDAEMAQMCAWYAEQVSP